MRIRLWLLIFILGFVMIPFASAHDGMSIEELKVKFPNGAYWNHPYGTPSNQDGWTNTPCTPHSEHNHRTLDGACGCNCFSGLTIQCEGFAFQLQEDAFGNGYGVSNYSHTRAVRDYQTAMNCLKAGDVIRFKQTDKVRHSIFITSVDGDIITYADCNANGDCQIRWDVPGTKSMLAETFLYMDPGAWDLAPTPVLPSADEPSVSSKLFPSAVIKITNLTFDVICDNNGWQTYVLDEFTGVYEKIMYPLKEKE